MMLNQISSSRSHRVLLGPSLCEDGLEDFIFNTQSTVLIFIFQLFLTLKIDLVQTILNQRERDNKVDHLLEVMADSYAFVLEAEPVKKIESHKRIVAVMAQQTTECAYFIREYAMNTNFSVSLSVHKSSHLTISMTSRETRPQTYSLGYRQQDRAVP
jgi:hypothetical protein